MTALRDAEQTLLAAVEKTITALEKHPEGADAGAIQLAREYAALIDRSYGHCRGCGDPNCQRVGTSAWYMRWIAPLLLDALTALGATPVARHALTKGGKPGNGKPSRLQQLRDSRSA